MINPYVQKLNEANDVMQDLIKRMSPASDMKLFKNIAAVYVVWQQEAHQISLESLNWNPQK